MTTNTNPWIFIRRAAHAALQKAFADMGIPSDLFVLPMADDWERLDVRGPDEIHWAGRNIVVWFREGTVRGVVAGPSAYNIVEDQTKFDPIDFGFKPTGYEYPFEIPFDISDIHAEMADAWRELPYKPPLKRPGTRPTEPFAIRSIGN